MQYSSLDNLYSAFLSAKQKVTTDTRKLETGSVFFALKGDNFDGNNFVQQALEAGCAYAVTDDPHQPNHPNILKVANVLTTLQQLATHHRRQFKIPVLGITGSNGKTTTKELINAVLETKYKTLYTFGNLNNHIGVPLTLLRLNAETEFAIIEMGANHQGEINALCHIAEPDFGMITNIGKAHLEGFGGIEGVKKGKSEMYRYLHAHGGKLFVNGDDKVLMDLSKGMSNILYGQEQTYYLTGQPVVSDQATFRLSTLSNNELLIQSNLVGSYNVVNCLAAAAIGRYFGVNDSDIKRGIEAYNPEMNRSQKLKTLKNTLILDAYNANPNSMRAAIDNFATLQAETKWAFLGDMFELGEYSDIEHQAIADLCAAKGIRACLIGTHFAKTNSSLQKFDTVEACKTFILQQDIQQATILIKGSRGMKMEQLQTIL